MQYLNVHKHVVLLLKALKLEKGAFPHQMLTGTDEILDGFSWWEERLILNLCLSIFLCLKKTVIFNLSLTNFLKKKNHIFKLTTTKYSFFLPSIEDSFFSFNLLSFIYLVCVCLCMYLYTETRDKLSGIVSFFPQCGFWGLNTDLQGKQQAHLPSEPPYHPEKSFLWIDLKYIISLLGLWKSISLV